MSMFWLPATRCAVAASEVRTGLFCAFGCRLSPGIAVFAGSARVAKGAAPVCVLYPFILVTRRKLAVQDEGRGVFFQDYDFSVPQG